ncbi:MAG TPA: glycosyltransferase family 4 protein [Edaphobacter sp.]|nr:glycosyltransferase family 4 protein [Edaphobacter sp.]
MNMRVLHVVKTSDGAPWAVWLAKELVRFGVDIHVVLPSRKGTQVAHWVSAGATIHEAQLDYPVSTPWRMAAISKVVRKLVSDVSPDIIHSHFVGTTLTLRHALGKHHPIPRIFQIPGPLHLEHALYRTLEIGSAGPADYWIASSRCIQTLLDRAGVDPARIFLSYYGSPVAEHGRERVNILRKKLGISANQLVVGNISWIYKPKRYLGQTVGLKCHEDMIEALSLVTRRRSDVVGVLVGSGFRKSDQPYADALRERASKVGGNRVLMPGALDHSVVRQAWPDFDCAIHVPLSENTGGVTEPMFAGVPTIASRVGGLPEVVIDGLTGKTVPPRKPSQLAEAILEVLGNLRQYRDMAEIGRQLTTNMYDVARTAEEVLGTYRCLLNPAVPRPAAFDSMKEVRLLHQAMEVKVPLIKQQ